MHLPYNSGKLHITIVGAELTRDTEVLGKMDPFCTITWETANGTKDKIKTNVHTDAGKNPVWFHKFDLDVEP